MKMGNSLFQAGSCITRSILGDTWYVYFRVMLRLIAQDSIFWYWLCYTLLYRMWIYSLLHVPAETLFLGIDYILTSLSTRCGRCLTPRWRNQLIPLGISELHVLLSYSSCRQQIHSSLRTTPTCPRVCGDPTCHLVRGRWQQHNVWQGRSRANVKTNLQDGLHFFLSKNGDNLLSFSPTYDKPQNGW